MEQLSPDLDTVEHIVRCLGKLRCSRTETAALKAAERAIEILAKEASRPFPDADSINRLAKSSPDDFETLCKAIAPFGDEFQIPLKGCDRPTMTLGEFQSGMMTFKEYRSALNWLANIRGPSSKLDRTKYLAAVLADGLVNEFSEEPPTTTEGGPVRAIGSLLYQAISGEERELKRAVDSVRASWRGLEKARGR